MSESGVPVSVRIGDVLWELSGIYVIFKGMAVSNDYREKDITWKSLE